MGNKLYRGLRYWSHVWHNLSVDDLNEDVNGHEVMNTNNRNGDRIDNNDHKIESCFVCNRIL